MLMHFRDFSDIYSQRGSYVLLVAIMLFFALLSDGPAYGQLTASTVSNNIVDSTRTLPGLVSASAYLFGLLFAVLGILGVRDHVEAPQQGLLKKGVGRLTVGGMLFSLPYVYSTMQTSIDGGSFNAFIPTALEETFRSLGLADDAIGTGGGGQTINAIFQNITSSLNTVPGLISAVSYLGGLVIGVLGVLKIKEHVESPDNVTLKEPVIRILTAGALLSLPTILSASFSSVAGFGQFGSLVDNADLMVAEEATGNNCGDGGQGVGSVICRFTQSTVAFPALLAGASYLFGMIVVMWGLFKIRDHVLAPTQTPLWDGISRFMAGGAFLSLPFIVYVLRNSVFNDGFFGDNKKVSQYNAQDVAECDAGLDAVLYCFMNDMFGPANVIITIFGVMAGIFLIMIGISRLLKSTQEGAKGPAGIGTIMTFITGAALLSTNTFLKAFSQSMFDNPTARSFAKLNYTEGMEQNEIEHVHTVISAVLMFLAIVGFVSFVRGLFIVRDVSEGSGQASMMAGITHLVGGALAVNLGPLLSAVQTTLGITQYGITFTGG